MCEKCAPFAGLWMETPEGLRRCDCADGRRLSEPPTAHSPALTREQATVFVEMLAAIPFFPGEPGARLAIGDELRSMCAGPKEADWLVTRMRRLYQRWPGPIEMRRVYGSKHIPWDGVTPSLLESEYYPDGIPSERTNAPNLLEAPRQEIRMLPGGDQKHEPIDDPKVAMAVKRLSASMPKVRPARVDPPTWLKEAMTAPQDRPELPGPTPQILTQADIDRAVAEHRAQKGQA